MKPEHNLYELVSRLLFLIAIIVITLDLTFWRP